jgi:hypothetical protein
MQTERVTFLTSRDHKSALDAYAARSGRSVGHVLREASARYIDQDQNSADEYEEALTLIVPELEDMLASWNRKLDSMEKNLDEAHRAVTEALARTDAAK